MKHLLTAFAIVLVPVTSSAQSLCWKHTSVDCDAIVSTEVGLHGALARSHRTLTIRYDTTTYNNPETGVGTDFSWEFAYLTHASKKWMIGPSLQIGGDDNGARLAAKARARHYFNARDSYEFSAGLVRTNFDYGQDGSGFTVDARLNIRDYISFMVGYDNTAWPVPANYPGQTYSAPTKRANALKVGVNAGSVPAVGATVVVAILFGLVVAAFANGFD